MAALTYHFQVDSGADLSVDIRTLVELDGQTPTATMAKEYGYANGSLDFSCSVSGNVMTLELTSAQTSNLESGVWVYEAKVTSEANVVTRVLQGRVHVSPSVE